MLKQEKTQDIDITTQPPEITPDIVSPLPVLFLCSVLFISVLNMNNFFTSYDKAMEEKANNKQAALSSIEGKYTDSFVGKTNYVDINGLFSRMVDKVEVNGRYKLNNGYLISNLQNNYSEMTSGINNLTNLNDYLDLYGIPFAYVQTPHVLPSDEDPMIPFGYETHNNGNSDRLLQGLMENNVNTLDLRNYLWKDVENPYDLFFKTDHHWNFFGAFYAHIYVSEFIDEILQKNLSNAEYFDLKNYNLEIYENIFLGSDGARTGVFFTGVDDLTMITPKFHTNLSVSIPNHKWNRKGTFDSAILEKEYLKNDSLSYFDKNSYCVYLDSNTEYIQIINHLADNDTKILLIKDSYSKPLSAFLSLHYKEIHLYQQGSKEELLNKIHEIQPDLVLQVRTTTDSLTTQAKKELEASRG